MQTIKLRINFKKSLWIFDSIIIALLATFLQISLAATSPLKTLDITMKLGQEIGEMLKLNTELASTTKVKPAKEGILSIKGPINFHFSYAKNQYLDFDKVRLVIYPMRDYKIDYVHIYPQIDYLLKKEMSSKIKSIVSQLENKGWSLHNQISSEGYDKALITSGQKDYAYYRYKPDTPEQGFKEYELVISAIRDLTVLCSSKVKTKVDESACKNRLIRIAFYGIK